MSVPQRQILADYLRDLRPLRPLRMMRSLVQAATYLGGEAAIPYRPFGQFLSAVFATTFCCFVHVNSWFVGGWSHVDSFHTRF